MPKRAARIKKPEITLDQSATLPLYRQLYDRLRNRILLGQLEAGTRLPSTRALASELGISRNTTALAYELLLLEGYIESRVGDGTRVACLQTVHASSRAKSAGKAERKSSRSPSTGQGTEATSHNLPSLLSLDQGEFAIERERGPFSIGQPDVTHFPYELWARLVARHVRRSLQSVSLYQNPQGYLPLREAIATHIGITRGVRCSPEQIILTAGAQGALGLIARVLLKPGDAAWVEDPGYEGARGALLAAKARLIGVPVDQQGLEVEKGRQLAQHARLAVVTPSHQFPTGVTMSLSRRLALLEWSREAHSWILEDDYDSEYRFCGRPLEALQGLDGGERVIYIGTFSKVLFPALRIGYLVVPRELLAACIATRRLIDVHLPLLEQLALTDFLLEGHFTRHVRKMRLLYLERRDILVEALRQELGDLLDITVPEAGMHLAAWLPSGISGQSVADQTKAAGLPLLFTSRSSMQPDLRDGLLLGFSLASPQELRTGVRTLARILTKMSREAHF